MMALCSVWSRFSLVCSLLVLFIIHGADYVAAHRFNVNNTLGSSLSLECFDPNTQPQNPDVTIVSPGTVLTLVIDDFSMSRMCAFSWLGTAKVKQFVVWDRNACDFCSWKVDTAGFSRKQFDDSFKQTFLWKNTCFSA